MNDAEEFAQLLRRDWREVTYHKESCSGTANLGGLHIHFRESANDRAVIVTIVEQPFLKAPPETMVESLSRMVDIYNNTGC